MNDTKIEWAGATWNPVTGCLHGCPYCYAARIAARFGGADGYGCEEDFDRIEGKRDTAFELTRPAYIKRGTEKKVTKAPFPFGFEPTFHRYRLDEPKRKKQPRNIFVCSMADLFGAWVPDEWITAVFDACREAPQHNYMFLTKNASRYGALAFQGLLPKESNFWYGVTAENHPKAANAFSHVPNGWDGYNLFLSAEPLQGEINILSLDSWPRLVIIGAETGNRKGKKLPTRMEVEGTANAAYIAGAAVFMKDSLIPIVGEEHMRRELPKGLFEKQRGDGR